MVISELTLLPKTKSKNHWKWGIFFSTPPPSKKNTPKPPNTSTEEKIGPHLGSRTCMTRRSSSKALGGAFGQLSGGKVMRGWFPEEEDLICWKWIFTIYPLGTSQANRHLVGIPRKSKNILLVYRVCYMNIPRYSPYKHHKSTGGFTHHVSFLWRCSWVCMLYRNMGFSRNRSCTFASDTSGLLRLADCGTCICLSWCLEKVFKNKINHNFSPPFGRRLYSPKSWLKKWFIPWYNPDCWISQKITTPRRWVHNVILSPKISDLFKASG